VAWGRVLWAAPSKADNAAASDWGGIKKAALRAKS